MSPRRQHSGGPYLVAVDAATIPASVAVLDGVESPASLVAPADPRTDAWLFPAIDRCLGESGLDLDEVDGFAVTVGPGMFTGIRVGLATCLGLAAPAGRPVAGIPTLEAVAESARGADAWVAPCVDARRGQVYGALYGPDDDGPSLPRRPVWGPRVCAPARMGEVVRDRAPAALLVGSGAALVRAARGELRSLEEHPGPLAVAAGRLAARHWLAEGPGTLPPAEPLYLRDADARPPRNPLTEARRRSR